MPCRIAAGHVGRGQSEATQHLHTFSTGSSEHQICNINLWGGIQYKVIDNLLFYLFLTENEPRPFITMIIFLLVYTENRSHKPPSVHHTMVKKKKHCNPNPKLQRSSESENKRENGKIHVKCYEKSNRFNGTGNLTFLQLINTSIKFCVTHLDTHPNISNCMVTQRGLFAHRSIWNPCENTVFNENIFRLLQILFEQQH